jgi:hypothetical protein
MGLRRYEVDACDTGVVVQCKPDSGSGRLVEGGMLWIDTLYGMSGIWNGIKMKQETMFGAT